MIQFTCYDNKRELKAAIRDNFLEICSESDKLYTYPLNCQTQINWVPDSGLFTSFFIQGLQFKSDPLTILEFRKLVQSKVLFKSINKNFSIVQLIGKGAFSVRNTNKIQHVYEITPLQSLQVIYKKPLAVKILDKTTSKINVILNEIQILRRLKGKHIVKLFEVYESKQSFYLVQEKLRPLNQNGINEGKLKKLTKQIIKTVKFLHDSGVMHRDIKEQNIMQSDCEDIVFVDFGVATEESISNQNEGTKFYQAPEIFDDSYYDCRCDWYSVGVTLYRLQKKCQQIRFQYTYIDSNQRSIDLTDFQQMNFFPVHGQELLKGLLQKDPNIRYSAKQALNSQFLKITEPCDEVITRKIVKL
ncbi:hypothetical protein pb186bvf_011070 [Paramecium bursaria]